MARTSRAFFSDIRNDTVVQTDGFCFFVDVSRQVGCGDRAHILDEEGGIPAQHGAEADGVAAAIFFDFGLRDLLVFFVARGNGDKPVDRRILASGKARKQGRLWAMPSMVSLFFISLSSGKSM